MKISLEKYGFCLNLTNNVKELMTLKNGIIKLYMAENLKLIATLFCIRDLTISKLTDFSIQINSEIPAYFSQSYKFETKKEANSWHDAIVQA